MKIGSTDIVNCKIGSTQVNEVRIGSTLVWQFSSVDPDAQAFITAAGITNPTQQTAINTLVVSLKANSLWTKMKALYPFVGGTASQHKWNLKNPLDTNAAFRLVFSGGLTHNSNGITGNNINSSADTFLSDANDLNINDKHISMYQRNVLSSPSNISMGVNSTCYFYLNFAANNYSTLGMNQSPFAVQSPQQGMFTMSKIISGEFKYYQNALAVVTKTGTNNSSTNTYRITTGEFGSGSSFANIAFASIGTGLSATDATNLRNSVQAFNTSLGRSVGPQTVSDADAQAFVTAANIQDQVQADAVNNLVIGLKADGLWTKMSAIYPFVGGDATSHKWNLKNPLDTNAAFRLVFSGGGTHSANGYATNGVNAFAETYYNPSINLTSQNSNHISIYSRTNNVGGVDMGGGPVPLVDLELNYAPVSFNWNMASNFSHTNSNSLGHYINTRTASNAFKLIKNGTTVLGSSTGAAGATKPNTTYHIGKRNLDLLWSNRQYAFASIGDGLTDTDAANLYTKVQAFQTSLGRQI